MPNLLDNTDRNVKQIDLIANTKQLTQGTVLLTKLIISKARYLYTYCCFSFLVVVVIAPVLLTGCGQSGDLYYAKEAPSNTNFILYKSNKTANAKAALDYDPKEIERAATEDPTNY